MLPLISVIIPTYNREDTIARAVDSVLNQNYENIELIIVDDRSDDHTREIIEKYTDSRIKYIYNDTEKHGAGAARNIGIIASNGEFIAFNDSDDEWLPGKLRDQYESLIMNGADINFCLMQSNKLVIPSRFNKKKCSLDYVMRGNIPGPPSIIGKASCFKDTLFDETMRSYEDNDWIIRLFEKYNMSFIGKVYVGIHTSEDSVSANYRLNCEMLEYVLSKHNKLYEKYPRSRKATEYQIDYMNALYNDDIAECRFGAERNIKSLIHVIYCRVKRYISVIKMMAFR